MTPFGGVCSSAYTFFGRDGHLDRGAMRAQAEALTGAEVAGIELFGPEAEVEKLSPAECRDVIAWTAADIAGAVPIAVSLWSPSLPLVRELVAVAQDHGIDRFIIRPPVAGRGAMDGWSDYIVEAAGRITAPLAIDLGRGATWATLSAEGIARLRGRLPGLCAIVERGGAVDLAATMAAGDRELTYVAANGGVSMTDGLRLGALGALLPPETADHAVQIRARWQGGELAAAEAAHAEILPAQVFADGSPAHRSCYGKRIFALRTGLTVHDRSPAPPPQPMGLRLAARWAEELGAYAARRRA